MANLLSELERFEQEMKELGSEGKQSVLPPQPPPPPPPLQYASVAKGHVPPPSPPPPPPSTGAAVNGTGRIGAPPLLPPRLTAATLIAQPVLASAHVVAPPRPPPAAPAATTSVSQHNSYNNSTKPISSYVVPPPPPAATSSYFPVPFHLQQQHQHAYQQTHRVVQTQYQYSKLYQQPAAERTTVIFPLHQQQQAQHLFHRDAQTITPEALQSVKAALASGEGGQKSESKRRAVPRKAAGQTWEDPTLAEWPENDHRLFCGDLGNEVNDEVLAKAFARFGSFNMARVIRDKRTGKTKGFGFVSFANPSDLALAFKDVNGKYVGNRPIKLRKSTWKDRIDTEALQNFKHNKRQKAVKPNKPNKKNILHK